MDRIIIFMLIVFFACAEQKDERPNIIVILVDDMGYSDIGPYGGEIPTPNLDHLSSNGYTMTNFYNAGRCCPTRASLLTGVYQHQAGIGHMTNSKKDSLGEFIPSYQGFLNDQCVTLGEALKHNGYQTYLSGKWHVGENEANWPGKRGFDHYFAFINGASSYFNIEGFWTPDQKLRLVLDGQNFKLPADFYMTDAITDHARNFIDSAATHNQPFFMYVAYTAPHWPLHALGKDIDKFSGKYMGGWDSVRNIRYQKMKNKGVISPEWELSEKFIFNNYEMAWRNDEKLPMTPNWDSLSIEEKRVWDKRMAVYAAMVHAMDRGVGEIREKLIEHGIEENTLIMFMSDNGACHEPIYVWDLFYPSDGPIGGPRSFEAVGYPWANVSNTPFRLFKHWTLEGGISTPFIAYWPEKIQPKLDTSNIGHIIDVMATCTDIAGNYPEKYQEKSIIDMEGNSLMPLLVDGKDFPERTLFWEHEGNWAVRDGQWKLVYTYPCPETNGQEILALYNIRYDRDENNNLIADEPHIAKDLKNKYDDWAKRVGVVEKQFLF